MRACAYRRRRRGARIRDVASTPASATRTIGRPPVVDEPSWPTPLSVAGGVTRGVAGTIVGVGVAGTIVGVGVTSGSGVAVGVGTGVG